VDARWERYLLLGLIGFWAGLAVYVLWDDWKLRQARRPAIELLPEPAPPAADVEAEA
jgi:hypothetical protein